MVLLCCNMSSVSQLHILRCTCCSFERFDKPAQLKERGYLGKNHASYSDKNQYLLTMPASVTSNWYYSLQMFGPGRLTNLKVKVVVCV